MKTLRSIVLGSGIALLATSPAWSAAAPAPAKSTSDLVSPVRRQDTVDKAVRLTRPPVPAPVPADLNPPYNPNGFDAPDPEEAKANAAAGIRPTQATGPAQPVGPTTDRELLEAIAARIQPTGSTIFRGKPLLNFGTKTVAEGRVITVAYPATDGRDYDIEIVSIDRTNFTLRFRGVEITRPIKPTK
jgi:hypothetical protein